ncbi:MAG: TIGR04283 family arsenosugar biosynthesis glycosyltransferase [Thermoplasmata archaeon]|nr:MAG: TIGR04283 family arsenosugar biosynthesis glycosyltransferase [Thermoplasmata archaeon]
MISIITPVLNEKDNIRPFFDHLNNLKGDFELVLVDGGSTDGTLDEVERLRKEIPYPLKVLKTSRGRGNQMNKGAEVAKGNILLFLHVDSHIAGNSLNVIEKEIAEGDIIGGGFTHSFSDPDMFLKITSAFGNFRARSTKIFFGDFGIFIRKDIFEKMGGYDDIAFLEDVEFCKKAKGYGKLVQIENLIVTSPRRYHSKGKFKLTVFFILAVLLNVVGFRPNFLYKYIVEM